MIHELRNKDQITRQDITDLLESIGKPGKKRDKKLEAVKQLNRENFQGIRLEDDIESYPAY